MCLWIAVNVRRRYTSYCRRIRLRQNSCLTEWLLAVTAGLARLERYLPKTLETLARFLPSLKRNLSTVTDLDRTRPLFAPRFSSWNLALPLICLASLRLTKKVYPECLSSPMLSLAVHGTYDFLLKSIVSFLLYFLCTELENYSVINLATVG